MAKHLNQFLRNKSHFPSNLSQDLEKVEIIFLTYNQLSQELIKYKEFWYKENDAQLMLKRVFNNQQCSFC